MGRSKTRRAAGDVQWLAVGGGLGELQVDARPSPRLDQTLIGGICANRADGFANPDIIHFGAICVQPQTPSTGGPAVKLRYTKSELDAAIAAEREACAKLADDYATKLRGGRSVFDRIQTAESLAEMIRERTSNR
jgi:hypothetical protein